ncbi:small-conductance mechanosensitive channel [Cylindrospermum stagnale PCC 7417]|uniref:Small-conductance mechanosensitive channel n=1 Tax=Cylindrospermum stagnale PCC 7417 TaxID=56107 RepID=K9X6R5_9NOST|nr:mechanosensitive ion channel domain-containing protein [Cylindrospermum stagnale]AFZ28178.1 small-conductance mechanosensitive channel [Cylindrospermum stagnale PCC 7417]
MDIFSEAIQENLTTLAIIGFSAGMVVLLLALLFILGFFFKKMNELIAHRFLSPQGRKIYQEVFSPYENKLGIIIGLIFLDLTLLIIPKPDWLKFLELSLGLSLTIAIGWLGSRLFQNFFDAYLRESATRRKINGELLVVVNFLADIVICVTVILIFAQTHKINLLGVIASLGIGGLAVAFAAQQTLQQLFGGIVLYIDRPFVVDDYIGLPDGTFGRVESIGLRSTKIRNSGKGTLTIVPNDSLIQLSIENFTGARKVVSLIYLTFTKNIPDQQKALIRQVILESTKDLFGIDSRNTVVNFKDIFLNEKSNVTQAQINFFILGYGEMGMDMRYQLLDIAKQNITIQLKEYGLTFELEERPVNIDAPITI